MNADDGSELPGYLAGAGPKKVLLLHEIFGLNAQMRGVADRLAGAGFTAFAIDLFDGRTAEEVPAGRALAGQMDWPRALARIEAAVRALGRDGRVALMGFCFGGAVALHAAAAGTSAAAVVEFYGLFERPGADFARIRVPLLAHFGDADPWIPNDHVDAFEAKLRAANVPHTIHRYAAGHGWLREDPDGEPVRLSWSRTLAFLDETLQPRSL